MPKHPKLINSIILSVVAIFGLATIITGLKLHPAQPARAASTYIVNSNGDEPDNNPTI